MRRFSFLIQVALGCGIMLFGFAVFGMAFYGMPHMLSEYVPTYELGNKNKEHCRQLFIVFYTSSASTHDVKLKKK